MAKKSYTEDVYLTIHCAIMRAMQEPLYKKRKFKIAAIIVAFVLFAFVLAIITIPVFFGQRSKSRVRTYEANLRGALHKADMAAESELLYVRSAEASEPVHDRKLIRKGDVTLKVEDIKTAIKDIKRIADDMDGVVFETNIHTWSDSESGYAVIKVPAESFDKAMDALRKIAIKVLSENVSTEDVTEKYIDFEARLNNMKAEEASLLKVMKKAVRVEDIISVNKELSRVRGEIDSLQGKLNYLKSQIVMSTITVQLNTEGDITIGEWNLSKTFKSSYVGLANNLKGFVRFIIRAVFYLPVILLYLAFVVVCYLIIAKFYRKFIRRGNKAQSH